MEGGKNAGAWLFPWHLSAQGLQSSTGVPKPHLYLDGLTAYSTPPDCVYALCILLKLFAKCFLLLFMESVVDHAPDFSHLRIGELPPQNGDHTELLLSASTQVSLSYLKLITRLANNRVMK